MKTAGAVVALAFLLLAGAFAVAPRAGAQDPTGAHGGDLRVALQDFAGLDPTTTSNADRKVLELVYDSLGRIDPKTLMIVPWAATGWTWDTKKNLTVSLRTDLMWSDGTPITANDVVYSLRQYKQAGVSRWDVSAVDARTVKFDFTTVVANEAGPGLFFTQGLTALIAWKNNAAAGAFSFSGPFARDTLSTGQLRLVPNTHHFSGGPNLNSVTYKWPYTIALDANGNTTANDAGCALMKQQVELIGWSLLPNDLTNPRDCFAGFGGFVDPQGTFAMTNVAGTNRTYSSSNTTYNRWLCNQTFPNSVIIPVTAHAVDLTVTSTSVNPGDNHDLAVWQDGNGNGRCDFGVDTLIAVSNGTATSQTIRVLHPAAGTYMAQVGLFSGTSGVFNLQSKVMRAEFLLSTDPDRIVRHVVSTQNPGPDFMYFGFAFNGGSLFVGPPGSEGQRLRSAIYQFVNKENYREIEPNVAITHGPVNPLDAPWAPASCPPWTPCNVIVSANTVPAPAPVNRKTDTDTGTQALVQGGFLDRDGDGIRQNSAGTPIVIRLLAPSFQLDPRKTTIANDMQFLLSSVGLNVTVFQYGTDAALDAAIAGCSTSCMYIKRYTAATTLPDWLYTMPEVVAANDPLVNLHLGLGANTCYVVECRQLHVGHVGHLLGAAADFLPVLNYKALDAFDFVTVSGWVNTFAGVNNFWTYMGLRLPALGSLSARVSIFPTTTLAPGDQTTVHVEARNALGAPVAGAFVELYGAHGTFLAPTGTTDANGIFETMYTAGVVTAAANDEISAEVTKTQYTGTEASAMLTVHPAPLATLVVSVTRAAPDVDSGNTTTITVHVHDASGANVDGALVTLSTDLPGATFLPSASGTTVGGDFTAQFKAVTHQGMTYRISASVSKAGFAAETASTSLVVHPDLGTVQPVEVTRNVPGFEVGAAIGAVAVVFAFVAVARRRRED